MSPEDRKAEPYFEHFAGFIVNNADGDPTAITIDDIEQNAASDSNPRSLRALLMDANHEAIRELSDEYLIGSLVLPNLPFGFYGDTTKDPVLLSADVSVSPPQPEEDLSIAYNKGRFSSIVARFSPVSGGLRSVSYLRNPQLDMYGLDWFTAERVGISASLFGGMMEVVIAYDPIDTSHEQ